MSFHKISSALDRIALDPARLVILRDELEASNSDSEVIK